MVCYIGYFSISFEKNHISALRLRHIELNYGFCLIVSLNFSFIKIIKRLVRSVKNNYSKKRSGKTSRKQFSIAIILESTSYTLENLSDLSFLVGGPFWTLKMLRAYVKNDKSYLVIFQIWFLDHFPQKKCLTNSKTLQGEHIEQRPIQLFCNIFFYYWLWWPPNLMIKVCWAFVVA